VGYKRPVKVLTWDEGHDMHGLEVRLRGLSVEAVVRYARVAAEITNPGTPVERKAEMGAELFAEFAKRLVSWNLEEDDGTPVPATHDGVREQDLDFILDIVLAWMEAVAGVGNPLPNGSNSGGRFPEVSIPMELLSASPGN
jgi:hypothetical protein